MGIKPITWPDMLAWSKITGIKPRQWEIDALTGIDAAYMAAISAEIEKPKSKKE